ncbi:hypothetical protein A3H80_02885 [Candidatus Roizmanbacteria bacterium RIFCSPLOWO2_02_FULL_37_19]|uniref:Uncharacterized protein n=1 Tax=Candidatus Roizmanbacteria bacterium RIFCSPHIGHO2_02_FULL_37_24 TaxID=1802037 RepID=A0A1F7GYY6_9BACT|nr:MAG: hypothetical protein A2862_03700 [Candidatus Roizmanbacteria bacterium RIFCSPHIGHO2_01_FULL_38_41]OGK24269.1 MAG: hypothetical protein A3C24_04180 [Candidatus Roizmanbacteria bacterium RIFCSPHIGHO2_02_FULL_37_24]OGK32175.1 MAG: hypothetical protein A3E10_03575 [Candidatus Roizmanbacteria bacterium RIFCSPHIGHO2_12_FULL_37_23]OGK44442.1 MAG: hypothetical protein A2956_01210 [Candidatus Roizmanbacteria bacterium RIFCSPLOWO2_01_FULL_37_57]OGK53806.1 MAG: hypothetical protein A3H80_02885 [Ca
MPDDEQSLGAGGRISLQEPVLPDPNTDVIGSISFKAFQIPDPSAQIQLDEGNGKTTITSVQTADGDTNITLAFSPTEGSVPLAGQPFVLHSKRELTYDGLRPQQSPDPEPYFYGTLNTAQQATVNAVGAVGRDFIFTHPDDYSQSMLPRVDGERGVIALPPVSRSGMLGDSKPMHEVFALCDGTLVVTLLENAGYPNGSVIIDASPAWDGKLVPLTYAVQRGDREPTIVQYYALASYSSLYQSATAVIQVAKPSTRVQLGLPINQKDPSSLTDEDADVVLRSVKACESDHNRKAWRQLLETHQLPDSVQQAIEEGLADSRI